MSRSIAERLDRVEGKPLKYGEVSTPDSFVRAGKLVEVAVQRAYPKQDAAAQDYGVSASLLSKQITNQDKQHLSFQRLWSMPLSFKLELVDLLMEDLRAEGAPVVGETTWRIERRSA